LKRIALLFALLIAAAFHTSLIGQVRPTGEPHQVASFSGATHLGATPQDWRNPIVVVDAGGVTYVERRGSTHRWIPASDIEILESVLSELPAAAWPQGRTVFVDAPQGAAVDRRVRKNARAVSSILNRLQISETCIITGC
jgi:hypothetical protein